VILAYLGPADHVSAIADVTGNAFDIRCIHPDPAALADILHSAIALLDASMRVRVTREMIEAAPELRIVAAATTGADHIDSRALHERGIPLVTLRGHHELLNRLTPAAEHSWLLLMACARRLAPAHRAVLAGKWERSEFPGIMLRGKTLGIVGLGRIGRWMARYAQAFDMKCQATDPYATDWPAAVERMDLDELLATSDFVTVHVHLTDETRGLLDARRIRLMKPGAILVNTSRGDIIDERALLDALKAGQIGAAGLDVLTGEPEVVGHPLRVYALDHDNIIITPHIGGFSPDAVRTVVQFSAEQIVRYLDSGKR
jgi:phosphoglycerate dehydrogenase-like enzyme